MHFLPTLTVRRKVLLLLLIPAVLQLLSLGLLLQFYFDAREAQRAALHNRDVGILAEQTRASFMGTLSAARGYFLSGNPIFRSKYENAQDNFFTTLDRLERQRLARQQRETLESVKQRAFRVLDKQRKLIQAVDQAGVDAFLEQFRSLQPALSARSVERAFEHFIEQEDRIGEAQRESLRAENLKTLFALVAVAVTAVMAALFVAFAYHWSVGRRIALIGANVGHLARGETLNPPLPIKDELGTLDQALHSMAKVIAERTKENETFVYSVSHDLRSPLVNLQGFSEELAMLLNDARQILQRDSLQPSDHALLRRLIEKDSAESIRFLQSAVQRVATIIDALLRLSRAGRVAYQWQMVDLNPVVARVVSALRNSIEEKRISMRIENLPRVFGDPSALEQLFANLIENALKYSSPERDSYINIGIHWQTSTPDAYTIFVRDNGLGIPAQYLNKLFLAFHRFHGDIAPGEGIGLSLVHRIVERHGGRVEVESDEGKESVFFITLPSIPREILVAERDELLLDTVAKIDSTSAKELHL